jgi:hypothetical protein
MKNEARQLTGGGKKENRRELDFYPTPKDVTISLMEFLGLFECKIHEPACGNGAMSKIIESYGHEVISSDIQKECYGTGEVDYLKSNPVSDIYAIITNPPFNLSEAFIRKALKEADLVAVLMKSQYWHAKARVKLFNEFPPAYILPLTWRPDFLEDLRKPGDKKGSPTMEVLWTVWIKGNVNSRYIPLSRPQKKDIK